MSPERQRVDVGGRAKFECHIQGFPIHEITWTRNGQAINAQQSQNQDRQQFRLSKDRKVDLLVLLLRVNELIRNRGSSSKKISTLPWMRDLLAD